MTARAVVHLVTQERERPPIRGQCSVWTLVGRLQSYSIMIIIDWNGVHHHMDKHNGTESPTCVRYGFFDKSA